MSEIHKILKQYWGYSDFRPLQQDIIQSVLSKNDTLALLPTGGGKSICFQIPALALDGICIVVSPLIALMKDQVANLKKVGIKATALYSGMSRREIDITLDNCVFGDTKFLYVSPERLESDLFIARLKRMNVSLLAVDEAHCISQWGYDFRPSYLNISKIRRIIPGVTTIALTASATFVTCDDIVEKLEFKKPKIFRKSFARENLSYSTFYTENKEQRILEILNNVRGTALVYVRNRSKTKKIAQFLQKNKISADYYHAGLSNDIRTQKQENWISNKTRVITCTNAFGMGIDKPDVRLVIHLDIPPNLESYYQEAGRAGRDEKLAYAVMLYNNSDIKELEDSIDVQQPSFKIIKKVYQNLTEDFRLAEGSFSEDKYSFELETFCKKYKTDRFTTYHALKKLTNQNIITLSNNFNSSSTISSNATPSNYLNFQETNVGYTSILELILRMYGSEIFDRKINVNEKKIANQLSISTNEVKELLTNLTSKEVLEYEQQDLNSKIQFVGPIRKKDIGINVAYLKSQKTLYEKKINSIVNYSQQKNRCRTQMILEYFDEITDEVCGNCDYCLNQKKVVRQSKDYDELITKVTSLLETKPSNLNEILELGKTKQVTIEVVQELMDIGKIVLIEDKYNLT